MAQVVLIRGLNVGGHRRLRPSRLAEDLRHLDAISIGAAGTLVVRRPVARGRLRAEVARCLPFDAEVLICGGRDVLDLMALDAFSACPSGPDLIRFASLLPRRPRQVPALPLQLPPADPWSVQVLAMKGPFLVGIHRREMRAIRYLGELDRIFGASVTTRSWSTITAVAKALGWQPAPAAA